MSTNKNLNGSKHAKGEAIKGYFTLSYDVSDPPIPAVDLLNSTLQFIGKNDLSESNALFDLSIGNGLTIISETSNSIEVEYEIPASSTSALEPPTGVASTDVIVYYEVWINYAGDTAGPDRVGSGKIKIDTQIVKN